MPLQPAHFERQTRVVLAPRDRHLNPAACQLLSASKLRRQPAPARQLPERSRALFWKWSRLFCRSPTPAAKMRLADVARARARAKAKLDLSLAVAREVTVKATAPVWAAVERALVVVRARAPLERVLAQTVARGRAWAPVSGLERASRQMLVMAQAMAAQAQAQAMAAQAQAMAAQAQAQAQAQAMAMAMAAQAQLQVQVEVKVQARARARARAKARLQALQSARFAP